MDRFISTSLDDVARLCEAGFYDHIVIGSGIGGGILARTLAQGLEAKSRPHVLVIERGGLLLDTHCTNIATPRWNQASLEGPSMDNAMVYDAIKDPFFTVTAKSDAYVGGPVYGIGGRSIVWGLYTPKISRNQLCYFPPAVSNYLEGGGYDDAYRLMTNDRQASMEQPYPHPASIQTSNNTVHEAVDIIIQRLNNALWDTHPGVSFEYCPMAAEFTARDPTSRLYQMVMGGYSTATWILEQVFNKSEHLNLLSQTRVMTVNWAAKRKTRTEAKVEGEEDEDESRDEETGVEDEEKYKGRRKIVESLTVVDQRGKERIIPIKGANVILCAGTIDTAAIALRSGLGGNNKNVGRGLTDHDIWGTRFVFEACDGLNGLSNQALRLHSMVRLRPNRELRELNEGLSPESRIPDIDCLLNITVNAPSFLGQAAKHFPREYINKENKTVTEKMFNEQGRGDSIMIQVVYCLPAELDDKNRVLNLPKPIPSVRVSKGDTSIYAEDMQKLAGHIRNALSSVASPAQATSHQHIPQITRAPFGVVAHEVGTMRMGEEASKSVVNGHLQLHGWGNLFACDLSVFPISPSSNPSLTLAALAQRLGRRLEERRLDQA
ncbi:hypothetical protein ONZ43_g4662 [Nemania bipapillata]|uniref:Uncharacterized protein n=1 Tax=Nemania bipapillata TaxID=110536 RepID=A0ACC2IJU3_9PEZI|nr:hypothetical protein ONZ43_g4662 [Nemania bipapillata]